MKLRKIFAGMTAAALSMTMIMSAAAATDLATVAHPDENDEAMNKTYYSVGAMAFFMNQTWQWNQSEWIGINEEGKINVEFSIGAPMADTKLEGKGTLGDMGVMVLNMPKDGYPYNVKITDAKFVAEDGTETVLDSVNAITEATEDPEGGFRIHIRPQDEVDEKTGEVKKAARPEVAGWEEEGAFNGGVLSMTIDLDPNGVLAGEAPAEDSKDDEKKDDEKKDDKKEDKKEDKKTDDDTKDAGDTTTDTNTTSTGSGTTTTTGAAQGNTQTGVASNAILAAMAMAAAGVIASKKRK